MNRKQAQRGVGETLTSFGIVLLALALAAGCATTPGKGAASSAAKDSTVVKNADLGLNALPAPVEPAQTDAAPATESSFADYRIGAGDVLQFRCLSDDTLSGPVEVRYDGYVSLPMVPDLKVAGLTRQEATDTVRKAYEKEFQDPRVSLSIMNTRSKSFYLTGDIARPGEFPYTRPITLLEAINLGGGLRQSQNSGDTSLIGRSQLSKVFVIRHPEGKRSVLSYNLRHLEENGDHVSDTSVAPGDIIYVPETVNLAYVIGEVKSPGAYRISEDINLLTLMALARGPVEARARMKQVVLLRGINTEKSEVQLINLRELLKNPAKVPGVQAGDVIYVPEKPLVRATEFVAQVQSTISPTLNTYMQLYDAYYTNDTYTRLRNQTSSSGGIGTSLLSVQQLVRSIGTLTGTPVAK